MKSSPDAMLRRRLKTLALRTAVIGLVLLLAILSVMVVRAVVVPQAPSPMVQITSKVAAPQAAAERLAAAIRIRTISRETENTEAAAFTRLHRHLQASFPETHRQLQREFIADHSALYTWRGHNPKQAPVILLGHLDVVPAETPQQWEHAPFSGELAEGFIWGRGAIDDKGPVLAMLEAVEALVATGFRPQRTVYFAFGHDEERHGEQGAKRIAATLAARGIRASWALDEGGPISTGLVPGVEDPLALIGIAEKGFASLQVTARGAGGHASMPPAHTAAGRLAKALLALENEPMPGEIDGPLRLTLEHAAPAMAWPERLLLTNLWISNPLVSALLAGSPSSNAALRTTYVATMLSGSNKLNVLPTKVTARLNARLHPRDQSSALLAHARKVIADPAVQVSLDRRLTTEASSVSRVEAAGYRLLRASVRKLNPDIHVAPTLLTAQTDSRYFAEIAQDIYRFSPLPMSKSDLDRVHGVNERLAIEDYAQAIWFYTLLLQAL